MKAQGSGHIINISSEGAIGPGEGPYESSRPDGSAYGSGKAHLERFTQGLASEPLRAQHRGERALPEGSYRLRRVSAGSGATGHIPARARTAS